MQKFFTALVLIPLGILFLAFAIANRRLVTVSFDPFNSADPAIGITLPLFMVIIGVAILGVLAGSFATWLRQGRWRRAAREHEAEARDAQTELARLKAATQPQPTPSSPLLLPDLGGTGLATRDKYGATL